MSDTIVAGAVVLTADAQRRALSPGWVRVRGGLVAEVGEGTPPNDGTVIAQGDVVLPGLVSAHQHLVDVLVRGGPTGPTFLDWLLGTYHAGLAAATPEDCALAIGTVRAAGLAAGVTTVVDCWSVGPVDDAVRVAECTEASVEAHRRSLGRTVFAPMFCEVVPEPWLDGWWGIDPERLCRPADVSLAVVEALAARHHRSDHGRTLVTPSPELPEMATERGLRDAAALAARLCAVMPVHLCRVTREPCRLRARRSRAVGSAHRPGAGRALQCRRRG